MHVIRITDLEADGLADYARLTDVALRRVTEPEGGLYIAESTKVITRALAAGHVPRSVLLQEKWLADVEPLLVDFPDVPVFVGEAKLLEQLTGYHLHRGALAAMHRPENPSVRRPPEGRPARRHPRGHRRPHQRRRHLPLVGRPRRRRRARHARAAPIRSTAAACA